MAAQNIYAQFAEPMRSVSDYMAEFDTRDLRKERLVGERQQNALAAMTQQQSQQAMARNALVQAAQRRAAEEAGGDVSAYADRLYLSGMPELIDPAEKVQKGITERGKVASENAGRDVETEAKVKAQYADLASLITTPEGRRTLTITMHSDPRLKNSAGAKLPLEQVLQMVDSMPMAEWQQKVSLGSTKYAELNKPTMSTVDRGPTKVMLQTPGLGGAPVEVRTDKADVDPNTRASVGAQYARLAEDKRQFGITETRAKDEAARAVTYQTDGDGNIIALPSRAAPGTLIRGQSVVGANGMQPIPGKDGGLTEGQSKALSYGKRMQTNRAVIEELEKGGTFNRGGVKATAETVGRVLGLGTDTFGGTLAEIGGTATNWTQSESQQRYETAKRNWIAANLRKESGAVIGTDEYRQADNQYFPQPGDDDKTKADKARLRVVAEETMLAEVPKTKRPALPNGQASSLPPGTVLKFDAQGNLVK